MVVSRVVLAMLTGLSMSAAPSAMAQPPRKVIVQCKKATALVVLPSGKGFGSAFCIDPSGVFVTNEHVVRRRRGDKVMLVVESGENGEKRIPAVVLRTDAKLDIALLKTESRGPFVSLKLGADAELVETKTVVAFGYPFGTSLAVRKKLFPNISVNVGRVTALRKAKGKLEAIQLDAQLNFGNSGGPVVADDGRVIGIVATGIVRSGVNFAIPVSKFRGWLSQPIVHFKPLDVAYAKRYKRVDFPIGVVAVGHKASDFRVKLTLGKDERRERSVVAKANRDGKLVATIPPWPKPDNKRSIRVAVTLKNGQLQGQVADTDIRFQKQKIRLSNITSVVRTRGQWIVGGTDGKQTTFAQPPEETLQIDISDGVVVPIPFRSIWRLTIHPSRPAHRIPYRLVTTINGRLVDEKSGHILVKNRVAKTTTPRADRVGKRVIDLPNEKTTIGKSVEIDFSTPYSNFTVGGGGRYLVFVINSQKKIVILDTVQGRVVQEIKSPTESDLVVAGREKLFIISPAKMMIQRWNLKTQKREKIAEIPLTEAPNRALLGANSHGPLMLTNRSATLIDTETLLPVKFEGRLIGGAGRYGFHLTTSHQGRTFTGIVTGLTGQSYQVMRLRDGRATTKSFGSANGHPRWVTPSADGSLLFSTAGIFTRHARPVTASGISGATIPTVDPRFFVTATFSKDKTRFAVCATADCRRLWQQEGGFPEMVPRRINSWHDIMGALQRGGTWRIQYIPWANVVATLPGNNSKVILRKFDLLKKLDGREAPYLFVDSLPPTEAFSGKTLAYQISAKSKAGGLRFKKEDGPPGCLVSPDGRVTWDVPPDVGETFSRIIVSIRDRSGAEIFHTFEVAIGKPASVIRVRSR